MHRPLIVIPCVMGLLFTAGLGTPEGGFAHAQTTATMGASPVTMEQVIDFAKSHYPAIKAARAEQRAAQAAVGVAKTDYLPRTDLLWQTNRATANNIYGLLLPQNVVPNISGPVIASDTTRSAWSSGEGALLSWQPFDFGVRKANVDAAREGSQAAEHAASLTTLEVSTAAASAFLDLAAAQQLVTAALSNVRRIEAFDKALHVLVENQLRPGADATQADAQLALARNQLIQAQTQEAVRQSVLAAYLERQGEQVAIDASQLLTAIPVSDLERAEARVHPFVLEEGALAMQQEARKRVLDRSYVPAFRALGSVSGRGTGTGLTGQFQGGAAGLAPDTFNWAAGIQVTFAGFDYFSLRQQKKIQSANVQAEHARYSLSLTNVSAAIEQARATLGGARQIAANTPLELSAAQASEQQQQVRYRSGLATVIDVTAAEGVLAQAEADDAIARLGIWRAELGLAAAQGDLQPFLLLLQDPAKGR
jgi:outer membrane protein TolC